MFMFIIFFVYVSNIVFNKIALDLIIDDDVIVFRLDELLTFGWVLVCDAVSDYKGFLSWNGVRSPLAGLTLVMFLYHRFFFVLFNMF